jgi:hypothetical protein
MRRVQAGRMEDDKKDGSSRKEAQSESGEE